MKNVKSRNLQFLFRQIILSFLTGSGLIVFFLLIQAIVYEQLLSTKIPWEIIVSAFTIIPVIVIFLNAYINQEIKQEIEKEKAKLLEENSKLWNNQLANKNSVSDLSDLGEMVRDILKPVAQNPNLSTLEKEKFISVSNMLDTFSLNAKSNKAAQDWLNEEKLIELSKDSGNFALTDNSFNFIETKILQKSKHRLCHSIYDCLTWIQASFHAHYYLTTKNLPKISDKERTIKALNWIKTTVLPVEIPESSVKELEIYFDKLIQVIQDI